MNPYLIALILGAVEGLTEFLPVSSTAHIQIVGNIIGHQFGGWTAHDAYWKAFAVVIQLGAVACLPIYFRKDLMKFLKNFPRGEKNDRNVFNHPLSLTLIAFVVTSVIALPMKKLISKNLENYQVIGLALLIGGVIMWIVDVMFRKGTTDRMDKMSLPQSLWIGAIQSLSALFPGTSRSMCTIAAGQTAGMTRSAALEFSFFLSIPTMFAATLHELLGVYKHKDEFADLAPLTHDQWIQIGIGLVTAFVVALVVVHLFMGWVRRRGFVPFAVYRIIIGIAVLIWVFQHGS